MSHDNELTSAVLAELKWEPSVEASHVGVAAKNGVVTLVGHVGSFVEKQAAETAASRVKGVRAIAEEIEVRLPFNVKHDDEAIAAAAVSRIAWNSSIPKDMVKVKVEKGWVTLSGMVEWNYQKTSAVQDIRWLSGVVGVSNEIKIKPRVNAANISTDINQALNRSWFNEDPRTVYVSAHGGKVTLTGNVSSSFDRQTAEDTAWAAPGVTSVENDIRVS